ACCVYVSTSDKWVVMSRGRGPRVGCPPPEGVDVVYSRRMPMVGVRVRATSLRSVTSTAPVRGIAVALIQILLFTGCLAGKKLSYGDTVSRVDASGTARVAVTAYDQRKLITSGQESPTFIGREWSLYHRATVHTASGRPLGDALTEPRDAAVC